MNDWDSKICQLKGKRVIVTLASVAECQQDQQTDSWNCNHHWPESGDVLSELLSIKDNPSHTLHCTTLLRQHSSFSPRLIKPCCQEKRLRESLLTFSVRLYTNFFLWQCYFSPTGHTCFPCETPISAMGVHLSATGVFTYVSLFTP